MIPKGVLSTLDLKFGASYLDAVVGLEASHVGSALRNAVRQARDARVATLATASGEFGDDIQCPIETKAKCVDP